MKNLSLILIGVMLVTGCCSTGRQWGQLEGYQDIAFVNNGKPLRIPSKAPRDDTYSLWQLSDKRYAGNCLCREGQDRLITSIDLRKGEELGFCMTTEGMSAYAGDLCLPLSGPDYSWRMVMTEADQKQIKQDNFRFGVTDVVYGLKFGLEGLIVGISGAVY